MKASLEQKLKNLSARYREVGAQLSDPVVMSNQDRYRDLGKEYAQLEPIVQCYQRYVSVLEAYVSAQQLLAEEMDAEIKALAQSECDALSQEQQDLEQQLKWLLLPKDPNDERNVFVEIRAGTGGDEAALFAGDLLRMYLRFAEKQSWTTRLVSESSAEQGGYKEVIVQIEGAGVYSKLKFESGAHRVQRVPATESQGRVHTSACTVAVLPEVDAIEAVDINPADLRIDTYRASGAGGQHVNRTDSAVRITHLPTKIVVECQDERSQHKNKARALSLLQTKILTQQQQAQQKEQAQERKALVGSGDRSERIRTYNFPQGRVTDHRINLTLYKLDEIIAGDLAVVVDPLTQELKAQQLSDLSESV